MPMAAEFDAQTFSRGVNELLVLSALRDGPKHGYQIALDVEAGSRGLFALQHGTLYPILHRLEADGLIRGQWSKDAGRRRKVYELTPRGSQHLTGETGRVREVVGALMRVLQGPERAAP
jgi:PadR family transcriptional regulator, regulatory protein PadR